MYGNHCEWLAASNLASSAVRFAIRLTKLLPGYDHDTSRPVNYIFSTLIQFLELVHDRHLAIFVFVTSELKVAVYS